MIKLKTTLFAFFLFWLSSTCFAEYRAESLTIDKVIVADGLVIATLSGTELENQDACSSIDAVNQVSIDLNQNSNANFLYTHLMTAMISKERVNFLLDGCSLINDTDSIPSITSIEIIS